MKGKSKPIPTPPPPTSSTYNINELSATKKNRKDSCEKAANIVRTVTVCVDFVKRHILEMSFAENKFFSKKLLSFFLFTKEVVSSVNKNYTRLT